MARIKERIVMESPKCLYQFRIKKDGADVQTLLLSRLFPNFLVPKPAEDMMLRPEFVIGPIEKVVIKVYEYTSLGVAGWPETDFFGPKGHEHVRQFGLGKCITDDAPYVRIAHRNQKLNEWIRFDHDPISVAGRSSRVFTLGNVMATGPCLVGCDLNSCAKLQPDGLIALRVI